MLSPTIFPNWSEESWHSITAVTEFPVLADLHLHSACNVLGLARQTTKSNFYKLLQKHSWAVLPRVKPFPSESQIVGQGLKDY